MNGILNITNGDSAVDIMKLTGIAGEYLPWRDVLHGGPVLKNMSFEALLDICSQFIIDQGVGFYRRFFGLFSSTE